MLVLPSDTHLTVDTELFEKHNIMDYSMLLAQHRRSATDKSGHDKDKFAVKGYQPKHRLTEGGLAKIHQPGDKPGEVSTQLWCVLVAPFI